MAEPFRYFVRSDRCRVEGKGRGGVTSGPGSPPSPPLLLVHPVHTSLLIPHQSWHAPHHHRLLVDKNLDFDLGLPFIFFD